MHVDASNATGHDRETLLLRKSFVPNRLSVPIQPTSFQMTTTVNHFSVNSKKLYKILSDSNMEMECIDKEGNEIIIGDTNGDSIAKRQSWREDDCSTCATNSDFNLDELFLMNPGTLFILFLYLRISPGQIGTKRDE